MPILGVIPVRYDSKRFPGKALFKIRGRTILDWVYSRASRCSMLDRLIVATDDDRIAEGAHSLGAEVFFSTKKHKCGSERVAEVAAKYHYPLVVNIQGDEVLINVATIHMALKALESNRRAWAGTVMFEIINPTEFKNPNLVKVVVDNQSRALYFSRNPIPHSAGEFGGKAAGYGHVGVYAFRNRFLQRFARLKEGSLEKAERLEQLRILENGGIIMVAMSKHPTFSINSRKDIKPVARILSARSK